MIRGMRHSEEAASEWQISDALFDDTHTDLYISINVQIFK